MAFMMVGNPTVKAVSMVILDMPGNYQKSSCSKNQLTASIRTPPPKKKKKPKQHINCLRRPWYSSTIDTRHVTVSLPVANPGGHGQRLDCGALGRTNEDGDEDGGHSSLQLLLWHPPDELCPHDCDLFDLSLPNVTAPNNTHQPQAFFT